jgi:hypothetical protein
MKNKRSCKMCGISLPPINCYIKTENDSVLYEEVQSLRGLFAFSKKNEPFIQKEMKKARNKYSQQ